MSRGPRCDKCGAQMLDTPNRDKRLGLCNGCYLEDSEMIRSGDGGRVLVGRAAVEFRKASRDAELEYVRAKAGEIYTPEGVSLWLDAPNALLNGKRPRRLVGEGRTKDVLDLIQGLGEGAFV